MENEKLCKYLIYVGLAQLESRLPGQGHGSSHNSIF